MVRANVTAKFPTTVLADADVGIFTNDVTKSLDADVTSGAVTFTLSPDTTGFEANMWADTFGINGWEEVFITAVDAVAKTVTVSRAKDGSVAVAHKQGQLLRANIPAVVFGQLIAEVKAIETHLGATGSTVTWDRALRLRYTGTTGTPVLSIGLVSGQADPEPFITFERSTDAGATWASVGDIVYDPTNDQLEFRNIILTAGSGANILLEDDRVLIFGTATEASIVYDSADSRVEWRSDRDVRFQTVAGAEALTIDPDAAVFFNVDLDPRSDNARDLGTASLRYKAINSVAFLVHGTLGDANAAVQVDSGGLKLGAGGASALDVQLTRGAANLMLLAGGDSFRLNTDGSTGSLIFGASGDVAMFRGAADRLDIATGDSLNLVSGALQIASTTVFESDRDVAIPLLPNADNTLDVGSTARNWANLYLKRTAGSILFMGADGLVTEANAQLFWDDANDVFVLGGTGGSESQITVGGSLTTPRMLIHSTDSALAADQVLHQHSATAARGIRTYWARSRGTEAAETIVSSGDTIGLLGFLGHDGTDYEFAAGIRAEIDGTPGSGDMPGRIIFLVTPDGSATLAEAFRVSQDKTVLLVDAATLAWSDIILSRGAANLLLLANGDSFRLNTDGSGGSLIWGTTGDVALFRGAANRLDLASGDSLNIVSGNVIWGEGGNLQFGTATGTKFGTATTQLFAFWNAAPIAQPADTVAFTDNVVGTVSRTLDAIPNPADTPVTADSLRDDLVANTIPQIRDAISSLADGFNDLRTWARSLGLMA